MEQQVVERWVDVRRRALQDGGDGALAEAGAVAFVVPEGLGVKAVEAQPGGQEEDEDGGEQESGGTFSPPCPPAPLLPCGWRQGVLKATHSPSRGARARSRTRNSTAAPNRKSAGRALIQVYCQSGMGAGEPPAVAYSATAS